MKHGIFIMAVLSILAACNPNTPQQTTMPIPSFTPSPILTTTPTPTETPTPESTSEVQKRIGENFKIVESPNGDYKVIEGDSNETLKIFEDGHSTIDRII